MTSHFAFRADVDLNHELTPEHAYGLVLPQLDALLPVQVAATNLDVASVVARVLGSLPRIHALRAEGALLPGFDVVHLDELERCALALSHANAQYRTHAASGRELVEVHREAIATRERLRSDAAALELRNLIGASSLRACKGLSGYKNVASDLLLLTAVLIASWDRIEGKCACTMEELSRAEKIGAHMLRLVGRRGHTPADKAAWADRRDRAFTVLVRHYHAVRRAVAYLRWDDGDADRIAPSLYAGRRRAAKALAQSVDSQSGQPVSAAVPQAEPVGTGGDIDVAASSPSDSGLLI